MAQGGLHPQFSDVGDAANVLLLAPTLDRRTDEGCMTLLTTVDPSEENVLSITFTGSPDDRLDVWGSHVGEQQPAKTAIVSVGDERRSAVAVRTGAEESADHVSLDFVSDPGDLTGLGVRITERLGEWEDDGNLNVACFHSLTALLQYADLERAYRFLHVLTGHFRSSATVAHFHMDPGAHDTQTINTIKSLMDAVVSIDDDEWTIATR